MKKFLSLVLVVAMIATLVACGSTTSGTTTTDTKASDAPVVFGFSGPLTGNNADFGEHALNGALLAAKELNAKGGLLGGRQVEIRSYDDKNSGEDAASVAELLISDAEVCAVPALNYSSGVVLVSAPLLQEAGLVGISPCGSHPDITKTGDYIFRNNMTEANELEFAFQMPVVAGAKKLAVVNLLSDFGQSFTEGFQKLYDENKAGLDFDIVCVSEFVDGTVDFAPNIAECVAAGADTIIFTAEYNNLASFAMQLRKQNKDIKLIGLMTSYTPDLVNLAGDAVEGMYLYSCLNPNSSDPNVQAFVKAYEEEYGTQPDFVAANAYDGVLMCAAAVEKAGSTDREAIKDALYEVQVTCTAGDLKFDEHGEALKSCVMFKIENGEFVEIENAFKLWPDFIASLK